MLTDVQIKKAIPPTDRKFYKISDGQNLYVRINKTGSKVFYFRYEIDKEEKLLSLGKYPGVSLFEARKKAAEMREMVLNGINPAAVRRAHKRAQKETFEKVAREWFNQKKSEWKPSHAKRTIRRMENHLFPRLGAMPLCDISAIDLQRCLIAVVNQDKRDTAKRLKSICHCIYKYAILIGLVNYDHTQVIDLPAPVERNFAHITDPKKIGELMRKIDAYPGVFIVRQALRLTPLVFLRPGELRQGEWSEIKWEEKEWHIPRKKMKKDKDHVVPLSKQALKILEETYALTGNGQYIFPGRGKVNPCISENTIIECLIRMGYSRDEMSAHGFRHMASTRLRETGWEKDAIEVQLAHALPGKIHRIYNKAVFLPERKEMMQYWADYLDELKSHI